MEQEQLKVKPITVQDRLRQLKERLEVLRAEHNQMGLQADQLQGNQELEMLENPEREIYEPSFPDPEKSGEMEEEGSSW